MADSRLDQLTELTSPASTDLVYVEHDPSGAQAPRKVQVGNLSGATGRRLTTAESFDNHVKMHLGSPLTVTTDTWSPVNGWVIDENPASHATLVDYSGTHDAIHLTGAGMWRGYGGLTFDPTPAGNVYFDLYGASPAEITASSGGLSQQQYVPASIASQSFGLVTVVEFFVAPDDLPFTVAFAAMHTSGANRVMPADFGFNGFYLRPLTLIG